MRSGRTAHHGGLAAEDIAARLYEAEGARVLARRWRCPAGEIDLIVATPDTVVFVEVKARRTRDAAALALTPAQTARLAAAAETWLGEHQSAHGPAPCRFDLVLVDGAGRAERIANALSFDA
jgi:putative endonuclease